MVENNPLVPMRAVVEEKKTETKDVVSLKFSLLDNKKFFLNPGQFNMLGLPGFGEAPVSFSSLLINKKSFIHTIRAAGSLTHTIAGLDKGDIVGIRGPLGNGWPLKKAYSKNLIITAGGIGIAPLRPVIHYVLLNRRKFRKVFLVYGVRNEGDILYRDELLDWYKSKEISLLISVDEKPKNGLLKYRTGVITTVLNELDITLPDAITFICGPEIMMRFCARDLIFRGQNSADIFVSLERRMKCGIAHCGHCQIGAKYVCKDGPVFSYADIKRFADTLL